MRGKSLILYVLIISLNLFLFLPVFYTYLILSPIHVLIYWLSFDSILSKLTFSSNWSTMKFVGIPLVCQWLFIILFAFINVEDSYDIKVFFSSVVFIVAIAITLVEALILNFRYSKYISKSAAS